ncbi:MAG: hypothetical protein LBK53_04300 [Heliobacteriaceae bacterium]|nr:hypothetical protein [Heliobacteriaceae bacterium]
MNPVEPINTTVKAAKRLNLLKKFGISLEDVQAITEGDAHSMKTFKIWVSKFNRKTKYKLKDCYVAQMQSKDGSIKTLKDIVNLAKKGSCGEYSHSGSIVGIGKDFDHSLPPKLNAFVYGVYNFINALNTNVRTFSPARKTANIHQQGIGLLRGKAAGKLPDLKDVMAKYNNVKRSKKP